MSSEVVALARWVNIFVESSKGTRARLPAPTAAAHRILGLAAAGSEVILPGWAAAGSRAHAHAAHRARAGQ